MTTGEHTRGTCSNLCRDGKKLPMEWLQGKAERRGNVPRHRGGSVPPRFTSNTSHSTTLIAQFQVQQKRPVFTHLLQSSYRATPIICASERRAGFPFNGVCESTLAALSTEPMLPLLRCWARVPERTDLASCSGSKGGSMNGVMPTASGEDTSTTLRGAVNDGSAAAESEMSRRVLMSRMAFARP